MATKKHVKHFLISVRAAGWEVHAYLMTDKPSDTERVGNMVVDEAEKLGPCLPVMLMTELTDPETVAEVRTIMVRNCTEQAERMLKTAKTQHLTIWGMQAGHPDNAALNAIH